MAREGFRNWCVSAGQLLLFLLFPFRRFPEIYSLINFRLVFSVCDLWGAERCTHHVITNLYE